MEFHCPHCEYYFTNKNSLKKHMANQHDSWSPSLKKSERPESDDENVDQETSNEESVQGSDEEASDDEGSDEEVSDDDAEDTDTYTYDEVQAILRYALQSNE